MSEENEGHPPSSCSAFLPYLHDMLAMGVPESTAMRWHSAIWLLQSHCKHMAEVIEEQTGDKEVLREAAMNARQAMSEMRPNAPHEGRDFRKGDKPCQD